MKAPKRTTYSREFKLEAVRLVQAGKKTVSQISRELGVPRQLLHTWARRAADVPGASDLDTFPGKGNRTAEEAKIARLERELAQAKEDIIILKKATVFFAKESR
jgi:transposase-like protein